MPISMHIEGYYRITIDEDDMRGTYIAHVDEDLDPADPDNTDILLTIVPLLPRQSATDST